MKVGQSHPYSLLERGVRHVFTEGSRAAGLLGVEPESSEPGHDVQLLGLLGCRGSRFGRSESFVAHELGAERALRSVLVVGPAAQPQVVGGRLAPAGDLLYVIELDVLPRFTATCLPRESGG
jgi:hypothetical protein